VVALNADTMFYDMSEPVACNEVAGWMRFSRKEARRKADGLAAHAMNANGLLMWLFAKANWLFRLPGIHQLTKAQYIRAMAGTRNVAWLSGPFFEKHDDWINSGRMLARLWLTMTKHDVYLHPFGSIITNAAAHAQMEEHFVNPNRKHPLGMLVRLGYSELPQKSHRLPMEHILYPASMLVRSPSYRYCFTSVVRILLLLSTAAKSRLTKSKRLSSRIVCWRQSSNCSRSSPTRTHKATNY
jgi:hypothetical protein